MRIKVWPVICGVVVASLLCRVTPASAEDVSAAGGGAIVSFATDKFREVENAKSAAAALGKPFIVENYRIGDGGCTDLIAAALYASGCKPAGKDSAGKYLAWGRALTKGEAMRAGDIIQFTSVVIKDGGYTWNLGAPDHTAIFAGAKGSIVTLFHQNVDGSPRLSRVRAQQYDLGKKVSGSYIVYRPQKK